MTIERLRDFVKTATAHYAPYASPEQAAAGEAPLMPKIREALSVLIASDDWLPEDFAVPHPQHYQQYLLHCDPQERFSLVSFVWGPRQGTPIHDHTVWGLIGMLRGEEHSQAFRFENGRLMEDGAVEVLSPGKIGRVTPTGEQDIHRVRNAYDDRSSISIHFYNGNIGKVRRHVFDPHTGASREFISGYANRAVPNIWGMV
ncbi:cysteine dioxygenase [Paraburkholderia sp. J41]|uniref:cysteine dioxygenase family protein n=1 Tax=Paraburkholderia sp. J41 TaxID=2805433 RepID=UPI002AC33BB5|nr:cysteine dioxygenase [Paraburkholderia sp. J41]